MSSILKGLTEGYFSRDENDQQNAMDTRRSSDLSRERNVGLDEPDELPATPAETRNGVYEYNVPAGQEKLAQDLGLQHHKGHWISHMPFQRANFQFGRPQFHEIPSQAVAEGTGLKPQTLASYKKKAGAEATAADKQGDIKLGNKRMSGIMKATRKEFDNDAKGIKESAMLQGIMLTESRTYKLWESAGKKLSEAQLTTDQINQLFQSVEKIQSAGGENRTMLGKGKDAASAVNKAWEDLKTKVQDSGPIKGVDALYDKAAEQLKQATGGDQGVMQYVQKYRDFAKKHPVAQSLIYSALIAAAGISGAGLGGAAALGLFKMVDKLLQGEKFSSASYQGAKTGAMAYGASKIGDMMKGDPEAASNTSDLAQDMKDNPMLAQRSGYSSQSTGQTGDFGQPTYNIIPGSNQTSGVLSGITGDQMVSHPAYQAVIQKFGDNVGARKAAMAAAKAAISRGEMNESVQLSESQIYLVIGKIVSRQRKLDEGIMDTVKGAAGKAVDWAKTKGTNLTTKITADKLLQAWKKAGSPTDSLDVASIIQQSGVPSDTVKQVYGGMKIPFAGEPGAGAITSRNIDAEKATPAQPGAQPTAASAPQAQPGAQPTAASAPQAQPGATPTAASAPQAASATTGSSVAQVSELLAKLNPQQKKQLADELRKELQVA